MQNVFFLLPDIYLRECDHQKIEYVMLNSIIYHLRARGEFQPFKK